MFFVFPFLFHLCAFSRGFAVWFDVNPFWYPFLGTYGVRWIGARLMYFGRVRILISLLGGEVNIVPSGWVISSASQIQLRWKAKSKYAPRLG